MDNLSPDDIDSQLQSELRSAVAGSLASRRPLLTHLNADTSWLLSIPVVHSKSGNNIDDTPKRSRRRSKEVEGHESETDEHSELDRRNYFHILIDPWLKGPQADVTRFLSQQWHNEESVVQSVEEILDIVVDLEDMADDAAKRKHEEDLDMLPTRRQARKRYPNSSKSVDQGSPGKRSIDLVVVSHEFTDHMHKDTLLEVDSTVPVFATSVAAGRIRAWKHFDIVIDMPRFLGTGQDWQKSSHATLPSWLSVVRLDSSASDVLNYHSAVMITFSVTGGANQQDQGEAVIYTPHGITAEQLAPVATSNPPIKTLALIHTMHNITLSGAQLNLGAHNGLKAQRLTNAKYWVGTHDEVKTGFGFVSWVLRRKVISLQEALRMEIEENAGDQVREELKVLKDVHFEDLKNGESLILE